MSKNLRQSTFGSRIADLVVLIICYLLFAFLLEVRFTQDVIVGMFFYVSVVFVCLRLARRFIFEYVNYSKRVLNILLGNISGLLTGGVVITISSYFLPTGESHIQLMVLASILAFFILGTVSPLVRTSNRDRIVLN